MPRQLGQIRKEAAVTRPTWVVISLSPQRILRSKIRVAPQGHPKDGPRGAAHPAIYRLLIAPAPQRPAAVGYWHFGTATGNRSGYPRVT